MSKCWFWVASAALLFSSSPALAATPTDDPGAWEQAWDMRSDAISLSVATWEGGEVSGLTALWRGTETLPLTLLRAGERGSGGIQLGASLGSNFYTAATAELPIVLFFRMDPWTDGRARPGLGFGVEAGLEPTARLDITLPDLGFWIAPTVGAWVSFTTDRGLCRLYTTWVPAHDDGALRWWESPRVGVAFSGLPRVRR